MEQTSIFQRLKQSLRKTREGVLSTVFSSHDTIHEELYEQLEEALIIADVGMALTEQLINELRIAVKAQHLRSATEAKEALIALIAGHMQPKTPLILQGAAGYPAVMLVVGVNGVGKTTSIGKLAQYYKQQGRKPMLAAADTFRAAAAEQLSIWAARADVPIVKHAEGADPAAVVYDAIASCKAKGCDLLICDTAGRLHNKKNLMNELEKMRRVITRELPDCECAVLLVLDAATGQNALLQAKAFLESSGVTDILLTKLDGTAKGGMAVAVQHELGLPLRFIGVGEAMDDLQLFDANAFAEALLG